VEVCKKIAENHLKMIKLLMGKQDILEGLIYALDAKVEKILPDDMKNQPICSGLCGDTKCKN
jgi:hypothetical protein